MCCLTARVQSGPDRPHAHRGQRGFTLIELVYATAFFMFGMTGILMSQVAAANGTARAGDLMMATTLTANALETARNTPLATLLLMPSQTNYFDRTGAPALSGNFFTVTITVTTPTSTVTYSEAQASTTWTASAVNPFPHAVTMQTRLGTS